MVSAYYHDNNDTPEDFTDAHNSGEPVSLEELAKIGVIYRKVDLEDELNRIAKERNYKNRDEVLLSVNSFADLDAYNAKMAQFYHEHFHEDEEIRYIVDGEGYFDVRNANDRWIRTHLTAHDLLILPAGIYHRFTLTSEKKQVTAVRLFQDEPKWEAINRELNKESVARQQYLTSIST